MTASAADVEVTARRSGDILHVIALRRGGTTSRVTISGLPRKRSGAQLTGGQVMFEYVQDPLPPPIRPDKQQFRSVKVENGSFKDWFGGSDRTTRTSTASTSPKDDLPASSTLGQRCVTWRERHPAPLERNPCGVRKYDLAANGPLPVSVHLP